MKKIISLLLLLALLAVLLTACAKSDPTGLWTAEIRFADYADGLESLSPGLGEKLDLTGLKLALKLDLSADGSFNLYTEQADLDRLLADLREPVREAARRSMLETYGLTETQLEDRLTELGLTMDGLTDQFFGEVKELAKPARITGTWRREEDSLILTGQGGGETVCALELTEETLTIQSASEDGLGFGGLLPLQFQK